MSETLEYMKRRAHELARSGKFSGWRSVAFELQFEPGVERRYSSGFIVRLLKTHFSGCTVQRPKKGLTNFVMRPEALLARHVPEAADASSAEGAVA